MSISPALSLELEEMRAQIGFILDEGTLLKRVSHPQMVREFSALVTAAFSLQTNDRSRALKTCNRMAATFRKVMTYANEGLAQRQAHIDRQERDFIALHEQYVVISSRLCKMRKEYEELNVQKVKLLSEKRSFEEEIKKLELEKQRLHRKIEQARQKRFYAITDINPIVGFFGGLWTGKYKRMIPFHSTCVGIHSCLTQECETFERKIEQKDKEAREGTKKLEITSGQLRQKKEALEQSHNQCLKLENKADLKEKKIKKSGRKITALKKAAGELATLSHRCVRLRGEIEIAKDLAKLKRLEAAASPRKRLRYGEPPSKLSS